MFCLVVSLEWKFNLSCVCAFSKKLGVCHVGRPFSRDRLILVIELDAVRQLM